MASPGNNLIVRGEMRPKSKFLGNSVASISDGITHVDFTDRKETYDITYPNVYARGILFGTMIMELADTSSVRCKQTDLICELEFKAKGYFSGSYNMLCGVIKRESTGEKLYELSGKWSEILYIKDCKTSEKREFFNALKAKIIPKDCPPLEKQDWNESRR
jgi:oxysterol-binding protein-related protein 8